MSLSFPPNSAKFNPSSPIPNGPFYTPLVSTVQGAWYPMVVGAGLNVDYADSVISGGGGPSGGVTLVNTGTGLTGGPITSSGTVSMANTTVTPGSYTLANITVDAQGRITAASDGTVVTIPSATPIVLGAVLGCTTLVKTSVGCNALVANSSGTNNSALGLDSLAGNTSGSCNTAVGHESLKSNTTGDNNVAYGSSALTLSNGSGNAAFGSGSLSLNSTAGCNSAFGFSSLCANTTGCLNTAAGAFALSSNVAGFCNTAVGFESLCASTTGCLNVSLGVSSGSAITTESGNLILGKITGEAGCSGHSYLGNGDGTVLGLRINELGAWSPFNSGAGLNTPAYGTAGQVLVSCGNGAAPQWSSTASITVSAATPTVLGTVKGCTQTGYTSLGCNALLANTGAANSALGDSALVVNSSGSYNTAVGDNSFNSVTTGNFNIGVGYLAGSALTTEDGNVVIGSVTAEAGCNNQIFLANGAGSVIGLRVNSAGAWSPFNTGGNLNTPAYGTAGQVLVSCGDGAAPQWATAPAGAAATPIALGSVYGCTVTGCTSLGLNALAANTGTNNAAIGENALCLNTTGCYNTAIGYNTMCGNTVGNYNTALGVSALSVGDPEENVAIGYCAAVGTSVNTGRSVVIGNFAGAQGAGFDNVIIGCGAAKALTSNSVFNVVIGQGAGENLDNACTNTLIGRQAGRNVDGGCQNTVLGASAGRCLTSGCNNTIIGTCVAYAGISSGSCNILLGSTGQTGRCLNGTENNNVIIGNSDANSIVGCSGHVLISSGADGVVERVMAVWNDCAALDPGGISNYGATGEVLTSQGATAPPIWAAIPVPAAATPVALGTVLGCTVATNTALGCDAFLSNTGLSNVSVGVSSLLVNTGNENVAVGHNALCTQTGGCGNVAVGFCSGASITTRDYNVLVGAYTLAATQGSRNVAIGYCAAVGTTANSSDSVAIGFCAGVASNGSDNVIIGSCAVPNLISSGSNSVIIGSNAGFALDCTQSNTFVGESSGSDLICGIQNTFLGSSSGNSLTLGNNNTAIGSGVGSGGMGTGCYNIYLGSSNSSGGSFLGTECGNVVIGNANGSSLAGCNGHVLISSGNSGVGERVMAVWNDCAALDPGGIADYGTVGYVLTSQGATAPPIWAAQAGGGAATPTTVGTVFGYTGSAAGSGVSLGCCALGNPSLAACGIGNVGIGYFAGYNVGSCGTSNYNTAVGNYALGTDAPFPVGSLRGTGNTALGFGAGQLRSAAATAASNCNTYIGFIAGGSASYGVNCNTFVGAFAGYPAGNATGVNNTTIGYCSQISTISSSNEIVLGNTSNNIIRAAVNSITTLSDGRDKSNVSDLPVGLEFINSLHPVKFTWQHRDPNPVRDGSLDSGFIAQEVQKVQEDYNASEYLGLVHDENPEKLEVTPGKLIPVLVKAIQELSAKNAELEERLAKLESTN